MAALDFNAARTRATRAAKSFSPQQLLILGGLGVVSVIGLLALVRWVSQPTFSALTAGASMTQVSEMTKALDEAGITYELSANGTAISVTQTDLGRARLALSAAGVADDATMPGYKVLDGQGLTVSDFKQQVDYKRAIEGELANTLMAMEGVDTARVILSLPEKALFKDDQDAPRASVLIGGNAGLDSAAVRAIMQTVAAAVPGLTTDNVTVTDTKGQILSVAGMSAGDDPLQMARKFEAATAAQAQTMLDTILGPGKSVVRVSAKMDTNQVESKATRYDKDNAVVVASKKAGETFQGPAATIPAGVVGVTGSTLVTAASQDQRYEKTDQVDSVAVGATETLTKQSPGTLQRLSVAVAVDQATLDQLGIDQQGLADLRQLVVAAVGAQVDDVNPAASRDTVELRAQTFDTTSIEAGDKALAAVASAQSKDAMVRYAKTGGALLVLLLAVLFLRKGLRSRKDEVAEIDQATLARTAEPFGVLRAADGVPAADEVQALLATVNDETDADRRALDPASEVLDLIDREPEDVAALLRSWVADRRS